MVLKKKRQVKKRKLKQYKIIVSRAELLKLLRYKREYHLGEDLVLTPEEEEEIQRKVGKDLARSPPAVFPGGDK